MSKQNLKPGWKYVRFGDVVHQIKDRVTNLETCELTEYTRGEHFETSNLNLVGRSKLGDGQHGSAFHMRFRKGDVLYVSRNPQLRKVAIADYNGICANTTYVCRADGTNLLHELLPFIMQTEDFVEYTIRHKRGSTNFYLNWSDIEPYEFALPPLEKQRRFSESLWALEKFGHEVMFLITKLKVLAKSQLLALLEEFETNGYLFLVKQLIIENPKNGLSPITNDSRKGWKTVSLSAISEGKFTPEGNIKFAEIDSNKVKPFLVKKNDVFVVRGNGNLYLTGKCGIATENYDDLFYPDLLIRLRFDDKKIYPKFASLQWNSAITHKNLISRAKSTNGIWKVNGQDVQKHTLTVPPKSVQKKYLKDTETYEINMETLSQYLGEVERMKTLILNKHMAGS